MNTSFDFDKSGGAGDGLLLIESGYLWIIATLVYS